MASTKNLFKYPRYWYHVSTTLNARTVKLIPWDEFKSANRSELEPPGARICVAPSIEQCITAIPYSSYSRLRIYKTKDKVIPTKPTSNTIFDKDITHEGWLELPTVFTKIGTLKLSKLPRKIKQEDIISESASSDSVEYSKEVLKWWKKIKVNQYIEFCQ